MGIAREYGISRIWEKIDIILWRVSHPCVHSENFWFTREDMNIQTHVSRGMWSAYRDPAQSSESGVQAQTLFPSDYASPNSAKFRYIKDVRGIETIAENAGHSWITSFPLSASASWDDYYTPLLARLPLLEENTGHIRKHRH
jgi:hypothetical protein